MEYDYIKNGDCLELMKEIPDGSIDMILCDLPYGTTACKWDEVIPFDKLWEQYTRIIKDNGAIVLFGSEPFSSKLRMSNLKMYKYDWIWNKNKGGNIFMGKYQPMKIHENITVFSKGKCIYYPIMRAKDNIKVSKNYGTGETFRRGEIDKYKEFVSVRDESYPISILNFSNASQKFSVHPTQKPVALLEYLIKTYTNENDVVLDNCMGSGSTCVAAKNTDRHYIGFELEKKYFDIARQRLGEWVKEDKSSSKEINLFNFE